MRFSLLEPDALEDVRVLVQARSLGVAGMLMAKQHSNRLMYRAMKAFAKGEVQQALAFARRELDFNTRVFGMCHSYTKSSKHCLHALRKHT